MSYMKRLISCILLLGIIMCLMGCQQKPALTQYGPDISEDVKEDIRRLYYEAVCDGMEPDRIPQKEWVWDYMKDGITYTAGYRYYGTFGDCIVWFRESKDASDLKMKLAGYDFEHPNYGTFYVYRNGFLLSLEDAYRQSLITAEDIGVLAERHAAYNAALAAGEILLDPSVTNDPLWLSAKQKQEVLDVYAAYRKAATGVEIEDLDNYTLRTVWQADDIYALYVDPSETTDGERTVKLQKPADNGEAAGYYEFTFHNGQQLFLYSKGSIYTLEEAYAAGVLKAKHLESLLKDGVYQNDRIAYYAS